MKALQERWEHLCDSLGQSGGIAEYAWRWLTFFYGDSSRHYHTLAHVEDMFCQLDDFTANGHATHGKAVLAMAVFFHDGYYEALSSHNEQRSVDVFEHVFASRTFGRPLFKGRVGALIMATRFPRRSPDGIAMAVMLDLDIASLGCSPGEFDLNWDLISKEYPIPYEEFSRGRKVFLKEFLESEHLYMTPYFRDKYEKPARDNIERRLRTL